MLLLFIVHMFHVYCRHKKIRREEIVSKSPTTEENKVKDSEDEIQHTEEGDRHFGRKHRESKIYMDFFGKDNKILIRTKHEKRHHHAHQLIPYESLNDDYYFNPNIQSSMFLSKENVMDHLTNYPHIVVKNEDLKKILQNEFSNASPIFYAKIKNNLEKRNVDLKRFRDFIFLKKDIREKEGKIISRYEIKERTVPKNIQNDLKFKANSAFPYIFIFIIFLFLGLFVVGKYIEVGDIYLKKKGFTKIHLEL